MVLYAPDVIKVPERLNQNLPGCPEGAKLLPWDESRIPSTTTGNPLPLAVCLRGFACVKTVATVFSPAAGTNATASNPTACEKFGVGKRPNGSDDVASPPNSVSNTPKPNAKGENERNNKRLSQTRPLSHLRRTQTARGHAATILSRIFVTDQDVTRRGDLLRVPPLDTAATIVARPCVA
jgi:hypothetical protein